VSFIRIGFGNLVSSERLITVVGPDSAPVRRLIQDARDRGALIDASSGKKCKSVLVMDSDHIVLSALPLEEIDSLLAKAANQNVDFGGHAVE
jgi:regulator of extracellular matrix RemA (YlzA/DUF370 family)